MTGWLVHEPVCVSRPPQVYDLAMIFRRFGTAVSRLGGHLAASVLALSMAAAWTNSAAAGEWFWYDPVRFAEDLAAGKTVFVAVHADWCTTCAAQAPDMLEVIAEAPFKDAIGYVVDFDTQIDFLFDYWVRVQSTLIVFSGGEEVGRAIAITSAESIRELFMLGLPAAPVVN